MNSLFCSAGFDIEKKEKPAGVTEWIEDDEIFVVRGSKNADVDGVYRPDGSSFGAQMSLS